MADAPMKYGKKPNAKVAKGALAAASAAYASSDKNYRCEEVFRDAIRAAKKAGCTDADCEKIVGSSVLGAVDRYSDGAMTEGERTSPPRGLEKTLQKLSSRTLFAAGFSAGTSEAMKKQGGSKEAGFGSEIAGQILNPLNLLAGNVAGALTATATKTRTTKEQAESTQDFWKNLLIPGHAAHNMYKRLGYSERSPGILSEVAKKREAAATAAG